VANGYTYELALETYPLVVESEVTIAEEIQCLLDAGWRWDSDRLVHPKDRDIWRMYKRVDSPKVGNAQRLDAEIEHAVRDARQRWQRMSGRCGDS
jgi:hypothetical protein